MRWLVQRWVTITDAITARRVFVIPLIVASVSAVWNYFPAVARYIASTGHESLLGVPTWTVAVVTAFLMFSFYLIQHATELRLKMLPAVSITFSQERSGVALTPIHIITDDGGGNRTLAHANGVYVRVHLETLTCATVRDCPAFVTSIAKRMAGDSIFTPIKLHNPIFLADVSVRPNLRSHVDFLSCSSLDNKLQISSNMPLALQHAFDDHGTYRFGLLVVAADVPSEIQVDVVWTGVWDRIAATQVREDA